MTRVDKLLLAMGSDEAWLHTLPGIGIVTALEAEEDGYITCERHQLTPRRHGHQLDLTALGKKRRKELLREQRKRFPEEAKANVERMGRCIACSNAAEMVADRWRCSNHSCALHSVDVTEDYWITLRSVVERLEQDADERVEHAYNHPHNCRCRECYIG